MPTQFCYYGFASVKDNKVVSVARENHITDDPLFDNAIPCQNKGGMIQAIIDNMALGVNDGDHRFSARGRYEIKGGEDGFEGHVVFEYSGWEPVDPPNLFEIMQRDVRPVWMNIVYPTPTEQ